MITERHSWQRVSEPVLDQIATWWCCCCGAIGHGETVDNLTITRPRVISALLRGVNPCAA